MSGQGPFRSITPEKISARVRGMDGWAGDKDFDITEENVIRG